MDDPKFYIIGQSGTGGSGANINHDEFCRVWETAYAKGKQDAYEECLKVLREKLEEISRV